MPTFGYTGAAQTYVVPDGVTAVQVECWGAEGSKGGNGDNPGALGGKGGYVKGLLAVTPGETLNIYVGGKTSGYSGGFNGGGDGKYGRGRCGYGGGGGGTSDVRRGGTGLNNRRIVGGGGAGGGGGGASYRTRVPTEGGGGGLPNGLNASTGGEGGTQSAGGDPYSDAGAGTFGVGGDGTQTSAYTDNAGGAGGGGGWYGGGGTPYGNRGMGTEEGYASYGGGGGSSYTGGVTSATSTNATRTGHGQVTVSLPNQLSSATLVDVGTIDPRVANTQGWTYSDYENDPQTRYEIGYREVGQSVWIASTVTSGDHFHEFPAYTFADELDYEIRVRVDDGTGWGPYSTRSLRSDSWVYAPEVAQVETGGAISTLEFEPGFYEVEVRVADSVMGFGEWSATSEAFEVINTNVSVFWGGQWQEVERFIRLSDNTWFQSNSEMM